MILEIKNIVKQYESHLALDDVSFNIPRGSIYGLLGPNGAGKTSLIRIITQITRAEAGEIYFNGELLNSTHIKSVGYLPEERGLYKKMKVGEQLMYLAQLKGLPKKAAQEKIDYWLKRFDISDWYHKNVEELSKGMQQKVQFIATVMTEPELLILDEPFSGFDPVNANIIKDEILSLNKKGVTIIFSTHRMESVEELCEYIGLINKSKVVLEGKLVDIKDRFRSGKFEVTGKGILPENQGYKILEAKNGGEVKRYVLSRNSDLSPKQFMQHLVSTNFEIESFQEIYPSINDIFLHVVEN